MQAMQISKSQYKVSDFLSWQRSGSLELSPQFQRRPVWPPAAKSYLIDSVVRGLPMPIVFIRARTDLSTLEPKREIVDGQQRLRTLFSFIEPGILKDYDPAHDRFFVSKSHNADIAGKGFRQLARDIQIQLLNYEFSVHTLPSDTDDRQVLQIFARLNSTGVKVNSQEIRNALFIGEFKTAMYELAYEQLSRWKQWGIFNDTDIARMQEVEATSEFALVMLEGMQGKRQKALDTVYEKKEESFPEREEVSRRFRVVMDAIEENVGEILKDLEFSRPALFYTLFVYFYDRVFGLQASLGRASSRPVPRHTRNCIERASSIITESEIPEDLARALRGATSDPGSRSTRLTFLQQICSAQG